MGTGCINFASTVCNPLGHAKGHHNSNTMHVTRDWNEITVSEGDNVGKSRFVGVIIWHSDTWWQWVRRSLSLSCPYEGKERTNPRECRHLGVKWHANPHVATATSRMVFQLCPAHKHIGGHLVRNCSRGTTLAVTV